MIQASSVIVSTGQQSNLPQPLTFDPPLDGEGDAVIVVRGKHFQTEGSEPWLRVSHHAAAAQDE